MPGRTFAKKRHRGKNPKKYVCLFFSFKQTNNVFQSPLSALFLERFIFARSLGKKLWKGEKRKGGKKEEEEEKINGLFNCVFPTDGFGRTEERGEKEGKVGGLSSLSPLSPLSTFLLLFTPLSVRKSGNLDSTMPEFSNTHGSLKVKW